jgi:CDP-diacylglycerol---serine O-phosphatidyltransferase
MGMRRASASRPGGGVPRPGERRGGVRRVVVVMPSAFTLGNLFFGFWAVVSATNQNFRLAGWFIVFAAILDMLDGRIARMSNTGTRFGAELDSLVDVISFGVAPALLMYFLEFTAAGRFAWVLCYIYVVAVALRLARYNVASHGLPPSNWFNGLPSPAAGLTLATYYPFSQTEWYRATLPYLLDLQHQGLVILMLLVALLMVSSVKYPKVPPLGFRNLKGIIGTIFTVALLIGGIVAPEYVLFPFAIFYIAFGLLRAVLLALTDQRGETRPAYAGHAADADADVELDADQLSDEPAASPRPAIHPERRSRFGERRRPESDA